MVLLIEYSTEQKYGLFGRNRCRNYKGSEEIRTKIPLQCGRLLAASQKLDDSPQISISERNFLNPRDRITTEHITEHQGEIGESSYEARGKIHDNYKKRSKQVINVKNNQRNECNEMTNFLSPVLPNDIKFYRYYTPHVDQTFARQCMQPLFLIINTQQAGLS